jgi:hypothetical protein
LLSKLSFPSPERSVIIVLVCKNCFSLAQ